MYEPRRQAIGRDLMVRGLPYHLREWGRPGAPCLVLVHGSSDLGATFQFVVDALEGDWHVLAPDWRGHGRTGWATGSYWQADFVADLAAILDTVVPGRPVVLAGHSMGANIASLYAAMRPGLVSHLVMLDAIGELLDRAEIDAHDLLGQVLQAAPSRPRRVYPGVAPLQAQLMRHNTRLPAAHAAFLASEWLQPAGTGWMRGGDPGFRRILPSLHRTADWLALWRRVTAPVLYVSSTDHRPRSPMNDPAELHRRMAAFRDIRRVVAPGTGHNVHHDAVELIAGLIERHARGDLPAIDAR